MGLGGIKEDGVAGDPAPPILPGGCMRGIGGKEFFFQGRAGRGAGGLVDVPGRADPGAWSRPKEAQVDGPSCPGRDTTYNINHLYDIAGRNTFRPPPEVAHQVAHQADDEHCSRS